jgi:hypothetical protein
MNHRNKKEKNIPQPPHGDAHMGAHDQHYESTSPSKKIIPAEKFHEGHEKDIPDKKDFMEHQKFENLKHVGDIHLGGPIETSEHHSQSTESEKSPSQSSNKQGFWDKTKEKISHGVDKLKNLFK